MQTSTARPAVSAANVPTATPSRSHTTPAPIVSENVAGAPAAICCTTFCWLVYETSVPDTMRCINRAYCTGSGRSKPHVCRTFSMPCAVAFLPAIR